MRELFTVIHPCGGVALSQGGQATIFKSEELEPIKLSWKRSLFADVHPLFAISDIRGSSSSRVEAITGDLASQMRLADEVLAPSGGGETAGLSGGGKISEFSTWMDRLELKASSPGDEIEGQEFLRNTRSSRFSSGSVGFGPRGRRSRQPTYFRDHRRGVGVDLRCSRRLRPFGDSGIREVLSELPHSGATEEGAELSIHTTSRFARPTVSIIASISAPLSVSSEPYDPLVPEESSFVAADGDECGGPQSPRAEVVNSKFLWRWLT